MSTFKPAALAAALLTFAAAGNAWPARPDNRIVPGARIAHLALKRYPGGQPLGKPAIGEAGMSQQDLLWVSRDAQGRIQHILYAHAVDNGVLPKPGPGVSVDAAETTSPAFRTADGLGVGSTLAAVRRKYPALKRAPNGASPSTVAWEDSDRGIGFLFSGKRAEARSRAIAVYIFTPRQPRNCEIPAQELLKEYRHQT